jgi:hypothetical protein
MVWFSMNLSCASRDERSSRQTGSNWNYDLQRLLAFAVGHGQSRRSRVLQQDHELVVETTAPCVIHHYVLSLVGTIAIIEQNRVGSVNAATHGVKSSK